VEEFVLKAKVMNECAQSGIFKFAEDADTWGTK
jgi:hypothetical protein